jgi:hypothetical protein
MHNPFNLAHQIAIMTTRCATGCFDTFPPDTDASDNPDIASVHARLVASMAHRPHCLCHTSMTVADAFAGRHGVTGRCRDRGRHRAQWLGVPASGVAIASGSTIVGCPERNRFVAHGDQLRPHELFQPIGAGPKQHGTAR